MNNAPLRPGKVIDDRFVLKRRLGSGGVGAVWLALDRAQNDTPIALKILHPRLSQDPGAIGQLGREASVLAQLDHPNITKPFLFEPEGDFIYLGMEYIDGRPLHEEIGGRAGDLRHLGPPELERIFGELCSAVSYAHSQNIVHRDLKPHNVMIVGEGERTTTKVLDFGIARLLEGSIFDATTLGRQIGSLFYMAPEQARGEPADARTDVFGLGTVLFELLTLKRAWAWDENGKPLPAFSSPVANTQANSIAAVLSRLASAERLRVSDIRPGLPPDLDEVVIRAVSINPDDRFQSVDALMKDALPLFRLIEESAGLVQKPPMGPMADDKTEVPGTGTKPYEESVPDEPIDVDDATSLDLLEDRAIPQTRDYIPGQDQSDATSIAEVNPLEEAGPTIRASSPNLVMSGPAFEPQLTPVDDKNASDLSDPELYNTTAMSSAAKLPAGASPVPEGFDVPTPLDHGAPLEIPTPDDSNPAFTAPPTPAPYPPRAPTAVPDTGPLPPIRSEGSPLRRHINLLMVISAGIFCGLAGVIGTVWFTQKSVATEPPEPVSVNIEVPVPQPKAPPPKKRTGAAGLYKDLDAMLGRLKQQPDNQTLITELQKRITVGGQNARRSNRGHSAGAHRGAERARQKYRGPGKLHRAAQNRQSQRENAIIPARGSTRGHRPSGRHR